MGTEVHVLGEYQAGGKVFPAVFVPHTSELPDSTSIPTGHSPLPWLPSYLTRPLLRWPGFRLFFVLTYDRKALARDSQTPPGTPGK